jgi:C-terminal processing protease CtpA/Prc
MKIFLIIITILITINCQAQSEESEFNFGFEKHNENKELSDGWFQWGDYSLSIDSVSVTGKKSGKITSTKNGKFGSIAYSIPANYEGKKIELQAYMKIKNVDNGHAGLLFRIDGYGDILQFDNMKNKNISGTADWQKYTVLLDYPENAEKIIIGGILTGDGEAWFDDFDILIDGKSIHTLEVSETRAQKILNNDKINRGAEIPTDTTLTHIQIQNLKTLGLIWGFLKYYHPSVASGKYNWDNELLKILPEVFQAESKQSLDKILFEWIESLGKFEEANNKAVKSENILLEPDLDWINNSEFSENLTTILLKVKNAESPKNHYYIALHRGVGNPDFKNESKYSTMNYPNTGYRLLALFRYWNIIQYYFPYKNLIEEDWKDVLEEFIPKMIRSKNDIEYTLNILELISRIHDTHANIWGWSPLLNHFGLRYANVELTFIEAKAVVTNFFDHEPERETGLEIGDVIISINEVPLEEIVKERLKYTPASNYSTKLRDISTHLLRTKDSTINVEFLRNNKSEKIILNTHTSSEISMYKQTQDTCFKRINKNIAYIDNGQLKREYLPELWKEIRKTKGLILDLRNYPSDFPIYELSSYLMPKRTPFVRFSQGSVEKPGLFVYSTTTNIGKNNKKYYQGRIVILVNETTQSSSEFHAMAYSVHPNAIVIGSTTAGADGNVSEFYLPGGLRTMISGIGVYYPDGRETQRVGIVPDIEIQPTIKGIKEGRDELLEKAISLINEK